MNGKKKFHIVGCGIIAFYLSIYLSKQGYEIVILDISNTGLKKINSGQSSHYLNHEDRWGNLRSWGCKVWLPSKYNFETTLRKYNSYFQGVSYGQILEIYKELRLLGFPQYNRRELEVENQDMFDFCRKYSEFETILNYHNIKIRPAELHLEQNILVYDEVELILNDTPEQVLFCLGSIQNCYVKYKLENRVSTKKKFFGKLKFLSFKEMRFRNDYYLVEIIKSKKYTTPLMYWLKQIYSYQSILEQVNLLKKHKMKMIKQYLTLYVKSIFSSVYCVVSRRLKRDPEDLYYHHIIHERELLLNLHEIMIDYPQKITLRNSTLEDANHNTGTIGRNEHDLDSCFVLQQNKSIKFMGTSAMDFPMLGNPTLLSIILCIHYLTHNDEQAN